MKTYTKTHKNILARDAHIAKITRRHGEFTVKGLTLRYSFPENPKRYDWNKQVRNIMPEIDKQKAAEYKKIRKW